MAINIQAIGIMIKCMGMESSRQLMGKYAKENLKIIALLAKLYEQYYFILGYIINLQEVFFLSLIKFAPPMHHSYYKNC
jgi:hypothetical protein